MKDFKTNIQYPPQTGPYKVFVKDKGDWRNHDTVRLQISVGNPKHSGDKFFALTEWAAARFDKVILIVSDTLQRHNLALDMGVSLDEAYGISLLKGERWLKENRAALDNISPARRVLTLWDDWMAHADYAPVRVKLDDAFAHNAVFRAAIEEKAREFCRRHEQGSPTEASFLTSIAYILEEVAAFAVMFRETRAIDVYPGTWFKEIFEVAATEDSPLFSGFKKAECLRVDFTRNKSCRDGVPRAALAV